MKFIQYVICFNKDDEWDSEIFEGFHYARVKFKGYWTPFVKMYIVADR
ncbi:MAG: hypothetical protein Q8933_09360 [Bacteroidota bacterium]|nr:hypothetical protein [Bacteroidota bacterium]